MKTKVRASKITIEKPTETSEVWVHVVVQQVLYDDNGNIVNRIPDYDYFSKPLRELLQEYYQYRDPNGNVQTIDGLAIMTIIFQVVITWLVKRYNGTIDEEGNVWL